MNFKKIGIIGYSGLIGGNFLSQIKNKKIKKFLFNSNNVIDLKLNTYDILFCSALPAEKWLANKFPKKDNKNTNLLIQNLKKVKTKIFILISTIDVNFEHTYGKNRLKLEKFVKKKFRSSIIIRLPGVFGNKLKKNVIFDLLNNHNLNNIYSNDIFQWYDLSNLYRDIEKIIKKKEYNTHEFFSEPIKNEDLIKLFKKKNIFKKRNKPIKYNFKPIKGYFLSKKQVIKNVKKFIYAYKK